MYWGYYWLFWFQFCGNSINQVGWGYYWRSEEKWKSTKILKLELKFWFIEIFMTETKWSEVEVNENPQNWAKNLNRKNFHDWNEVKRSGSQWKSPKFSRESDPSKFSWLKRSEAKWKSINKISKLNWKSQSEVYWLTCCSKVFNF